MVQCIENMKPFYCELTAFVDITMTVLVTESCEIMLMNSFLRRNVFGKLGMSNGPQQTILNQNTPSFIVHKKQCLTGIGPFIALPLYQWFNLGTYSSERTIVNHLYLCRDHL